MTDAPAPVIHAHWHANNDFSLSGCGIRFERRWELPLQQRWELPRHELLTHDMAKVTCEACRKLVAAAGLAVTIKENEC